jgi:hypothetical protein
MDKEIGQYLYYSGQIVYAINIICVHLALTQAVSLVLRVHAVYFVKSKKLAAILASSNILMSLALLIGGKRRFKIHKQKDNDYLKRPDEFILLDDISQASNSGSDNASSKKSIYFGRLIWAIYTVVLLGTLIGSSLLTSFFSQGISQKIGMVNDSNYTKGIIVSSAVSHISQFDVTFLASANDDGSLAACEANTTSVHDITPSPLTVALTNAGPIMISLGVTVTYMPDCQTFTAVRNYNKDRIWLGNVATVDGSGTGNQSVYLFMMAYLSDSTKVRHVGEIVQAQTSNSDLTLETGKLVQWSNLTDVSPQLVFAGGWLYYYPVNSSEMWAPLIAVLIIKMISLLVQATGLEYDGDIRYKVASIISTEYLVMTMLNSYASE